MAKFNKNKNSINLPHYRINDEITFKGNVRIVGDGIESTILDIADARMLAVSMGLDLIDLNTHARPAVLKIANYEKMMYEMKKNLKKAKHNQDKPMKEVQLSANIASHDIETKASKAREFIEDGSKVKVVLSLKGRELTRRDDNKKSLLTFITLLEDVASVEGNIRDEGNRTIVILKKK